MVEVRRDVPVRRFIALSMTSLVLACGVSAPPGGEPGLDARTEHDPLSCDIAVAQHAIEGARHLPTCSPTSYATTPPSSGNHYAVWAAYRNYGTTFPPGFWVHSLEHGAVVIGYNCPDGCSDEVAAAESLIDSLPADCGASPKRRLIMLPDPHLDVRFAASAWGFTLRACSFDRDAFASFIAEHYGHGPEAICVDGIDPTAGGPNGTPLCP
jgi:hypothetical protein